MISRVSSVKREDSVLCRWKREDGVSGIGVYGAICWTGWRCGWLLFGPEFVFDGWDIDCGIDCEKDCVGDSEDILEYCEPIGRFVSLGAEIDGSVMLSPSRAICLRNDEEGVSIE